MFLQLTLLVIVAELTSGISPPMTGVYYPGQTNSLRERSIFYKPPPQTQQTLYPRPSYPNQQCACKQQLLRGSPLPPQTTGLLLQQAMYGGVPKQQMKPVLCQKLVQKPALVKVMKSCYKPVIRKVPVTLPYCNDCQYNTRW